MKLRNQNEDKRVLEKIRASEICHAFTASYRKRDGGVNDSRKWCGITYAKRGGIVYKSRDKDVYLDSDHAVLLPMGSAYEYYCTDDAEVVIINFLPAGSFNFEDFSRVKISDREALYRVMERLETTFGSQDPAREVKALALFYEFISALEEEERGRLFSSPLRRAIEYISSSINDPMLSNSAVADTIGISEVYLRKIFKRELHTTPAKYLRQLRIERAMSLLVSTQLSILDVAALCGYADRYSFSHVFKRECGITPGEYRRVSKKA